MTNKITVSATIHAAVSKVWNYYNSPLHIVHWNFADPSWHCPSAESDFKVGGNYKARMEAKDGSFGFDFGATFTEIEEHKKVAYEFGGRHATILFVDNGATTDVTVSFDPETQHPAELQQAGWQSILNNFKQYTENN